MNWIDEKVFIAEIEQAYLNSSTYEKLAFLEGINSSLTILANEEFNYDKIKEYYPVQCSLFSSAQSAYRSCLRVAHEINIDILKKKINIVDKLIEDEKRKRKNES